MPYMSPNKEYPRYPGDIQLEHPEWSVEAPLPEGWVFVEDTTPPSTGLGQTLYVGEPEQIDGIWKQSWLVRDLTPEELEIIDAPRTAKEKLVSLGFSEAEILAIFQNRMF